MINNQSQSNQIVQAAEESVPTVCELQTNKSLHSFAIPQLHTFV